MPSFMDNLLRQAESIRKDGVFSLPISGDRKVPSVATRDIASAAAELLLDKSWTGVSSRPLLGPEDLSYNDIAAILSDVLGTPVRFERISDEAFKARLRGRGIEQFRMAYMDQLVVPGVQDQRAALKTAQFGRIVKIALQLVDQGCCGHAEFGGLDTHEKSFGDIGNAAFENHTGNLWVSGHAMHGIQRPD